MFCFSFSYAKAEPEIALCPSSMKPTDLVQWNNLCFAYGKSKARECKNISANYVYIRLNSNFETGVKELKFRKQYKAGTNKVEVERPGYQSPCYSNTEYDSEKSTIDSQVYENYNLGFSGGGEAKKDLGRLDTERRPGGITKLGRCLTTSSPFARYLSSLGDLSEKPRQRWEFFIGRLAGRRLDRPFDGDSFQVVRLPYTNGKIENYCVFKKLKVLGKIKSLSLVDFDTPVGGNRVLEGFQKTWKLPTQ